MLAADPITSPELLFFNPQPTLLPLYEALRRQILTACPATDIKVSKSQISFRCRYIFAMASLPRRKAPGHPATYLMVSLGMPRPLEDARVAFMAAPYPGRWTCHIPVSAAEGLDSQLLGWIKEAHLFALEK